MTKAPINLNIVQNVTLMGGAINFSGLEKERKWHQIFNQTISGQLRNIYSTNDYVLLGYSLTHDGKQSAGRNQLNFEYVIDGDENESSVLKIQQTVFYAILRADR